MQQKYMVRRTLGWVMVLLQLTGMLFALLSVTLGFEALLHSYLEMSLEDLFY